MIPKNRTGSERGKVFLAGAGPGDPDLITLKLANLLKRADSIIIDRLVNPEIINRFANPRAKLIFAGKQGYDEQSIPQWKINEIILEEVQKGLTVLRLKGGDVAIFSNISSELETLIRHQIEFEIVPGITAASGASAYAGIPLTARGYSEGVQFLSFNPNSIYSPEKWKRLATSPETLVFYMSSRNIFSLAEILLRYSRKPDLPIALIEQATTDFQRVRISNLRDCAKDFTTVPPGSPSLVIIGEVVHLHQSFRWFHTETEGTVFPKL